MKALSSFCKVATHTQKYNNPKASRRKKIIKAGKEINKIETKITEGKINETESLFLDKFNKIDLESLQRQTKEKIRQDTNYQYQK